MTDVDGITNHPAPRGKATTAVVCLGLACLCIATYGRVWNQDFVHYDDSIYVFENEAVRAGLTAESIKWAVLHPQLGHYHPLPMLTYMLDVTLFGVNPGAMKIVSLLFHTAAALALFLAFLRMTGALWPSAFVAALFALHPLHVEPVVWISSRKDVLSGLFFGLTLLAYARFAERPSLLRYLAVPLCYGLGLISKSSLITLPCVLLLLDYWPLQRLGQSEERAFEGRAVAYRLLEKAPLFLLAGGSALLAYHAQTSGGGILGSVDQFPLHVRAGNAALSYGRYVFQVFWPFHLAPHYPHPGAGIAWTWVVVSAVAVMAISGAALWGWRRYPFLLTGWLWYLGVLVPVIGFVQVGGHGSADRYTYLPLTGFFLILAWGGAALAKKGRPAKALCAVAGVVAVLLCAGISWVQTGYWRDSETLFRHAIAATNTNARMHDSLAGILITRGDYEEAIEHCRAAIDDYYPYPNAHTNLGSALLETGHTEEAIEHYRVALQIDPNHNKAHYNLGNAYYRQRELDKAAHEYQETLRLNPRFTSAYFNLGIVYTAQKRYGDAAAMYREVLARDPGNFRAEQRLQNVLQRLDSGEGNQQTPAPTSRPNNAAVRNAEGTRLFNKGNFKGAAAAYREALRTAADNASYHSNLGNALFKLGQLNEAVAEYQEALRLDPTLADARNNLGSLYFSRGQLDEAIQQFRKAIEAVPQHLNAHNNLGICLQRQGKLEEALAAYAEVIRIDPNHSGARDSIQKIEAELQGEGK